MLPLITPTATIAAGQAVSNSVDCGSNFVVGLIMPDAWSPAPLSVLVSIDNVKFYDLFTGESNEFMINVAPGAIVAVDSDAMVMGQYIKLRSGTRKDPVPQTENRLFTVITSSKITSSK